MSTSSGAPRPRQNCEPPNQGRKSPIFTPVSTLTPLSAGIYNNAIRLRVSSKNHFTPSEMSQALNLFCSPLLHHQLATIIETACGLAVSGSAFPQPPCVWRVGIVPWMQRERSRRVNVVGMVQEHLPRRPGPDRMIGCPQRRTAKPYYSAK